MVCRKEEEKVGNKMITVEQVENFGFVVNLVALVGLGLLVIGRLRGGGFFLDFDSGPADYADSSRAGGLAIICGVFLSFIAVGASFVWKEWGWQIYVCDLAFFILMFFARQKIEEG